MIGIMVLLTVLFSNVVAATGPVTSFDVPSKIIQNQQFDISFLINIINSPDLNYNPFGVTVTDSQNNEIFNGGQLSSIFYFSPIYAQEGQIGQNGEMVKITYVDGGKLHCNGIPTGHYTLKVTEDNVVGFSTCEFDVVNPASASVPEFPTIAAPVAAILGLIAIFGRRRNIA